MTSIDVEQLETSNWSLGAKYVKKTTKADTPTGNTNDSKDKKKKRKKKKKLPKNYDPKAEVDPERWLPRYERSTFKKKKDKRGAQGVGKGTQGAVGDMYATYFDNHLYKFENCILFHFSKQRYKAFSTNGHF